MIEIRTITKICCKHSESVVSKMERLNVIGNSLHHLKVACTFSDAHCVRSILVANAVSCMNQATFRWCRL